MNRREFIKSIGLAAGAVAFGGVTAAALEDASLDAALTVGDVFTIDGWFAFNPVTRLPTTHLQHFVVTATTNGHVDFHPRMDVPKRHTKRPLYVGVTQAVAPSADA